MPKGVESGQLANASAGRNLSNSLEANGANVLGSLTPALSAAAYAPSGYTPGQKAMIDTASQQSAGGTNAGAVGSGGLYAARTRNAGAAGTAIGSSSRAAGAGLSKAATGTEVKSADLAQKNREVALGGLGSIGSEQTGAGIGALNSSNQALAGADQSAANNPLMKLLMQGVQSGGQVAGQYLQGGYANG
jgi:hypothetical protein